MSRNFTADQIKKLVQLIREGMAVRQETEDLNAGLKDTVNAVAEEMQIKASIINRAIKIAHRGDVTTHSDDHETLESILIATKYKEVDDDNIN